MLSWLLGLLPTVFKTIGSITSAIANEKIAAINATTQQDAIEAQERVKSLEAQRDVLIADSVHSKIDLFLRSILALGPIIVLLKLFVWDKTIGSFVGCSGKQLHGTCTSFNTDALGTNQWNVVMVVLGFYFLHTVTLGVAKEFNK